MKPTLAILFALGLSACAAHDEVEPLSHEELTAGLDKEQRAELHEALFAEADTDANGTLSLAEVEAAPPPAPELAKHFAEIDADDDGEISHAEIAAAMARHHH